MATYIAVIHKDPTSNYGVTFPDFPGCVSAGSTMEEARLLAKEALDSHVQAMKEFGEVIPPPSDLDAARSRADGGDTFFLLETLEVSRPVRVNISVDDRLLHEIDGYAKTNNLTRSGLLALAVREYMRKD